MVFSLWCRLDSACGRYSVGEIVLRNWNLLKCTSTCNIGTISSSAGILYTAGTNDWHVPSLGRVTNVLTNDKYVDRGMLNIPVPGEIRAERGGWVGGYADNACGLIGGETELRPLSVLTPQKGLYEY